MYEDDPAAMLMSPHARGAEAHSPPCMPCAQGKVRDTYDLGDKVVIVTTDRQSAFDRLLASVPFKGQVGSWDGKDRNAYSVCGGPPPFPARKPASSPSHASLSSQVLNQTSAWWMSHTTHIVKNALLSTPDPNVSIMKKCTVFPVEFVCRGFMAGVLWGRALQGGAAGSRGCREEGLQEGGALYLSTF